VEGVVQRSDGTRRFIQEVIFPIRLNRGCVLCSMIRDVTDQKQAENAVRQQEALLRSILDVLPIGVCMVDENARVIFANPAVEAIWGGRRYVGMEGYHEYKGWWADTGEPIKPEEWASARAVFKGETSINETINIECFDGSRKTIYNTSVPMYDAQGKITGALTVNQDITERTEAYQLLEQRVAERTRELSALLEVSRNVSSTLDLQPLLDEILGQLRTVIDFTGAAVGIVEDNAVVLIGYDGPVPREQMLQARVPLDVDTYYRRVIEERTSIIIDEVRADEPRVRNLRDIRGEAYQPYVQYVRSWLGVPLIVKDKTIGILRLDHAEPHYYTADHARLAMAFASQASVAIENARLYAQAQRLAALEERQRLARELHDSISQALYAINLAARTARAHLDRDPSKAAGPLDYALNLAAAAFADMRALIFELRPESLEAQGLTAGLARQIDMVRARHGIEVEADLDDEPEVPIGVKEAIYRVAQEALNNVVKHARATRISLRLATVDATLLLEVCDNGIGFDPGVCFSGHLGLRSMRERIERLGGNLEIDSRPGGGTRILVRVPLRAERCEA